MIVNIYRLYKNGKRAKKPLYNVQVKSLDQASDVFFAVARKEFPENWNFQFEEDKSARV